MPLGSMIMITAPSPRMVLPENMSMWRSFVDIGLTTLSSVWETPAHTLPKVWLAASGTPQQFDHRQLRNGKAVAAGFHDQRRDDRKGQRDLDGDRGALAMHRLDVD